VAFTLGIYGNFQDTGKRIILEVEMERRTQSCPKCGSLTDKTHDLRRQGEPLTEFDPTLFRATVEFITVHTEKGAAVTFRDGSEIHVDVCGK